ncbi:MAG: DNA/RNA nuclease SfsA [Deltaproteobacteria bacterium]|nr:DNA/RNA nuclease SfsA [Deltaproteobacteria bacterium]
MSISPPPRALIAATLQRRHKRFLADVTLEGGEALTAHCANPGSMRGLLEEGARVWLSDSYDPQDPKTHARKLRYSLEHIELRGAGGGPGALVCVNTLRANAVARLGVAAGRVPALRGLALRPEAPWRGSEAARFDFALHAPAAAPAEGAPLGYLEVKSASLSLSPGEAAFPDSVTARGQRHLRALMEVRRAGLRAVLLFVVTRDDAHAFRPAHELDPAYAALLSAARAAGVEVYAHACHIDPHAPPGPSAPAGVTLGAALPIVYS